MKTLSNIFLFLSLTLFSTLAWAEASQCSMVFTDVLAPKSAGEILNAKLTARYPNWSFMTHDPDVFMKTMQDRFEAKKLLDPKRAFEFDFSELGMPLVKDMTLNLDKKIIELSEQLSQLTTKHEAKTVVGKVISLDRFKRNELEAAVAYLKELQTESNRFLQEGKISYFDVVEFSYFYSRAIGHFDTRPQSFVLRLFLFIDRSINGYKQMSITREYALYKTRSFSVFQKPSSVKNFRSAEVPFKTLFTSEHLDTIWIPTNESVARDIFMRLMNKNINLIGVTLEPILADGVLRPGGDFYNHDVRHESFKYYERNAYNEKNGLSDSQIEAMSKKSEEWLVQYKEELSKVADKDMRRAIDHLVFNFHHDSGFPFIPNAFLHRVKNHAARNLYYMMKWSGQGADFKDPGKNLDLADKWLTAFWTKRVSEETAILMGEAN